MLRYNFSSRAGELSGGDAIVVSIPKSGRTWVRAFLCAYYCRLRGHPFTLQPAEYGDSRIPRIIYSHDRFEERTKADLWARLRGKYRIPGGALKRARVILLARDPRDAFVSHYIQLVRRSEDTPNELKQKSISELLRHPDYGIGSIVDVMNGWMAEFAGRENFILLRYESLRAKPKENFAHLLAAVGEKQPKEAAFDHALAFSDFGNMKKMEAAGEFDSKILTPGDVSDPESFKVRRGQVGGYREYLPPEDQQFATIAISRLDARYGYFS